MEESQSILANLVTPLEKKKIEEPMATYKVDQCRSNITLLEEHNQFARGYMWLERVTGLSRVLYIMLNNLHLSYGQ